MWNILHLKRSLATTEKLDLGKLTLLSQFKHPCPLVAYGVNGYWKAVLGERPENVLNYFVSNGFIVEAPLSARIDRMSVKEIKDHLKTLKMKVSGKRDELVKRLAEIAIPDLFISTPENKLWVLSQTGWDVINPHIQRKENHRKDTEETMKKALVHDDWQTAVGAVVKFHETWCLRGDASVESMFPSFSSKEYLLMSLKILKPVEKSPPACLSHLSRDAWQRLYEAVTWAFLWDEDATKLEKVKSLDLGSGIKPQWAAHMLSTWVQSRRTLIGIKQLCDDGAKIKVRILTGGENEKRPEYQCPQSDCYVGILYDPDKVPEIPIKGCTRQPCCACCYISEILS